METHRETDVPTGHRQKRPRKNASRACDLCKAKKTRCDGIFPCSRCRDSGVSCAYDSPYSRGSAAPIVATPATESMRSSQPVNSENDRYLDHLVENVEGFLGESSNLDYSRAAQMELRSQPASPPTLTRGNTSTVNQAVRPTKQRQHQHPNRRSSLYFTEPPFPPLDLARYSMPNTEHGLLLMGWYFENASPTYRFLHRPTMEKIVCQLCASSEWLGRCGSRGKDISTGKAEEALVLMSWALACQLPLTITNKPLEAYEKEWLRQKGYDPIYNVRLRLAAKYILGKVIIRLPECCSSRGKRLLIA